MIDCLSILAGYDASLFVIGGRQDAGEVTCDSRLRGQVATAKRRETRA